jgi:hypothetical protein
MDFAPSEGGFPYTAQTLWPPQEPVMSDTEKLKRPPFPQNKVTIDDRGRSVWTDTVETANLELVSTQRLKKILAEEHEQGRDAVRQLAETQSEGYLAHNNATGVFSIIETDELQKLLDSAPARPAPTADAILEPLVATTADDDLSLVSTQALRQILDIPDTSPPKASAKAKPAKDPGGGFDPYNTG